MIMDKYNKRAAKVNSLVCVGLDSEFEKIPGHFKNLEHPQFEFNKWVLNQTAEFAAAFKFNIAFYEARGEQGLRELKMSMDYVREKFPDVFTICDAKRADIGNSNNSYVKAIFDELGFDATTLIVYPGKEALKPFLDRADKACIFWCRSSNPGAGEFQDLLIDGKPLWQIVAEHVAASWNFNNNCMLVFGATYPEELASVRRLIPEMTFLVPGLGAQGGDVKATVEAGLNGKKKGMIINSSRGIIFAQNPAQEAKKLRDEINKYR
jgi:orotidine 5'-phosphate decarboxylase subfamily 2